MRIPHIINQSARGEYEPSIQTISLLKEVDRLLISEHFTWDINLIPHLSTLCVISISKNFEKYPRLDELVNCADRDHLLEILSTDLPLTLVVPLIEDEIYWIRRYRDKYGVTSQRKHIDWTWKCIYLENHMRELIEQAQPQYCDEEDMEEITNLLNPFVHRIDITQLQTWLPPLNAEKEDVPLVYPSDHINLEPIFRRLTNITELVICFTMKNVSDNFSWNMFKISVDDCKRLDQALNNLKKLRSLMIHNSAFEDKHCQALMRGLIKNTTLEELDLSNCQIGDTGVLCIAKLLMTHSKLEKLTLDNNRVGKIGGEGLGYAMMQETCCPLKHLNMRLNPLGHDGIMGILRCLVRVFTLEELVISGCGFADYTSDRIKSLLILNTGLTFMDISNNWIGPGGAAIIDGLLQNETLLDLDMRETNIDADVLTKINRKLMQNRGDPLPDEKSIDIVEELEEIIEILSPEKVGITDNKGTDEEIVSNIQETVDGA